MAGRAARIQNRRDVDGKRRRGVMATGDEQQRRERSMHPF
jgi:hypothetical protein